MAEAALEIRSRSHSYRVELAEGFEAAIGARAAAFGEALAKLARYREDPRAIEDLVLSSLRIKKGYIEEDELDKGSSTTATTFGHASRGSSARSSSTRRAPPRRSPASSRAARGGVEKVPLSLENEIRPLLTEFLAARGGGGPD